MIVLTNKGGKERMKRNQIHIHLYRNPMLVILIQIYELFFIVLDDTIDTLTLTKSTFSRLKKHRFFRGINHDTDVLVYTGRFFFYKKKIKIIINHFQYMSK